MADQRVAFPQKLVSSETGQFLIFTRSCRQDSFGGMVGKLRVEYPGAPAADSSETICQYQEPTRFRCCICSVERRTEAPPIDGVNNQVLVGKLTASSAVASGDWFVFAGRRLARR